MDGHVILCIHVQEEKKVSDSCTFPLIPSSGQTYKSNDMQISRSCFAFNANSKTKDTKGQLLEDFTPDFYHGLWIYMYAQGN